MGAAYQSIVRIAALTVGRLGTATERLDSCRPRCSPASRPWRLERAGRRGGCRAGRVRAASGWRPGRGTQRLRRRTAPACVAGRHPRRTAAGEVVRAWEQSVAAFERYGRRPARGGALEGSAPRTPSGPPVTAPAPARCGSGPRGRHPPRRAPCSSPSWTPWSRLDRPGQRRGADRPGGAGARPGGPRPDQRPDCLRLQHQHQDRQRPCSRVPADLGAAGRTEAAAIAHLPRGLLE